MESASVAVERGREARAHLGRLGREQPENDDLVPGDVAEGFEAPGARSVVFQLRRISVSEPVAFIEGKEVTYVEAIETESRKQLLGDKFIRSLGKGRAIGLYKSSGGK